IYIPEEDAYRCPADQRLTWRFTSAEKGMTLRSYWTSKCAECPLKTQCTTGKERRIKRWEHEAVIDAMQDRLDGAPKSMRVAAPQKLMLLSTSVEIRQSKIASWPTIRRSRICVFTQPPPFPEIWLRVLDSTQSGP